MMVSGSRPSPGGRRARKERSMRAQSCSRRDRSGFTLLELVLALSLTTVLVAMAVPITNAAIDEIQTASAARHLAARIMSIRMDAIRRSTSVALRFVASTPDYLFGPYADGNG